MATLWVNQSGSNTAPYDTKAKGATTIATAVAAMGSGDTLIIADGTYTGLSNRIRSIPSGSDNNHRTVVQAENNFGVSLSGITCGTAPINEDSIIALYQKEYIDVIGCIIKDPVPSGTYTNTALEVYDCSYIRIMRCGIRLSDWSDSAKYGGQAGLTYCSYCLFEDVFACGDTRYGLIMYGATNAKALIYADSSTEPGALTHTGAATAISDTTSWQDLAMTASLSAGWHWLGMVGNDGFNFSAEWTSTPAGSALRYRNQSFNNYVTPENPWDQSGDTEWDGERFCIYATYTPAVVEDVSNLVSRVTGLKKTTKTLVNRTTIRRYSFKKL